MEDFREERARSWEALAMRYLTMAWVCYAVGIALAIFSIRYEWNLAIILIIILAISIGGWVHMQRIQALKQVAILRNGRRS